MIENRLSGYLYYKPFGESNEKNMAWSLIVHKNTIKNYSTALQAFSFRSLSLYPLFPFHKGKYTSVSPQPNV